VASNFHGIGIGRRAMTENYLHRPVLESLEAGLRELLRNMPETSAAISVRSQPEVSQIRVTPTNPRAAAITVIVPNNESEGVTLIAGKGSYFEIPPDGHRYTNLPLLDEVKSIASAVIAGGLQESVNMLGDEVVQGVGTINLPRPMTVRWRQFLFRPFRKKEKREFSYEPYY
jgi:hypothetical protein